MDRVLVTDVSGGTRVLRRVAGACALVLLLLLVPAAGANASTWPNEQAMVDSGFARETFVAAPEVGHSWSREQLIARYHRYYKDIGFGNVLTWAPQEDAYHPLTGARWAGCGDIGGPDLGTCPDGTSPLHLRDVRFALADTTIHALEWDNAFIALSCANFSERQVQGPTPEITGTKFEDVNGNGARDPGEPGLAGWTIDLYDDGTFVTSTQTDAEGNYSFELDANRYDITSEHFEVREVQQPGWVASRTPGAITVPFGSANATFDHNDFGNYRPATIEGVKYEDMEADGHRDADDPTLPGWTIDVTGASVSRSAVTDSAGAYQVGGLKPGTYTVAEELQPGWRYSSPADGTRTITVRSGDTATAEFGNYRPATISGVKFDDHGADRLQDAGDQGLQGWTIALSGGRSADATTLTGADGAYRFTGLIPGTYVVGEVLKDHWRQSAPASGTHTITVRSGETGHGDFGNVCLGTSQLVITDEDTGAPIGGVEVRIDEVAVPGELANDPPLPLTTTATPTFADLLPGTYRVTAFLPDRVYTTDADLTSVDGRLAVVKQITVPECGTVVVPIRLFQTSNGKNTGGMKVQLGSSYATAGWVFMTRGGVAEGSLEYVDHSAGGMNLHSELIEQIYVRDNEAWIGGLADVDGVTHHFELHLVDNGEPGRDDRFELLLDNGYRAGFGETIEGGNDQVHPPQPT